jgi:hypothetical protein
MIPARAKSPNFLTADDGDDVEDCSHSDNNSGDGDKDNTVVWT